MNGLTHNRKLFTGVGRARGYTHLAASAWAVPTPAAMPAAVLTLELLLSTRRIDLHAITSTVKSDLGLTIQVLRYASRALPGYLENPGRLDACLVHLGVDNLKRMLLRTAVLATEASGVKESAHALWRHARTTAMAAELIASQCPGEDAEKAYLEGLLHDIGQLPSSLGWARVPLLTDPCEIGCVLASAWALPSFVSEGIIRYHARVSPRSRVGTLSWFRANHDWTLAQS